LCNNDGAKQSTGDRLARGPAFDPSGDQKLTDEALAGERRLLNVDV